jgi:hypothetical protein
MNYFFLASFRIIKMDRRAATSKSHGRCSGNKYDGILLIYAENVSHCIRDIKRRWIALVELTKVLYPLFYNKAGTLQIATSLKSGNVRIAPFNFSNIVVSYTEVNA